jgi:hypothetical protein
MANDFSGQNIGLKQHALIQELHFHGYNWMAGGAVLGLGGGIVAPLIGSILTAIAWFTGPIWHGISVERDGMLLLFVTIPLLIFGAHCLDLLDRQTDRAQ